MERMITGIKPSNSAITLGNYLGCLLPTTKYQDEYELFIFIADLHALTIYQDPAALRQNTENLIATFLAAGLDPKKVCIFKQSDIFEHNALEWVLTCNTNLSDLTKMPQYKNYVEKHKGEATPTGMLMYPSLMNADILLYNAKYVPVGEDQKPHVDLTRDIAEQFNKVYGDTFILPEALIVKQGAKIMSLTSPNKKMSKSESDRGTIYLNDSLDVVRNKIKKAVTDNEGKIYYNPETKPGISNLLTIMSCLTNKSIQELEEQFKFESNYGVFKTVVADVVCAELEKIQTRIANIKQSNIIQEILQAGKEQAKQEATQMLATVYNKIGIN